MSDGLLGLQGKIGAFSLLGSESVVEMIGLAGFQFVVLDTEHAPIVERSPAMVSLIRAAECVGMNALVRAWSSSPEVIGGCLDIGADAVVVPHAVSAEQVRGWIDSATLAPRGVRGAAPVVRAAQYGFADPSRYVSEARSPGLVIPLIEDPQGVAAIDEIVAVDGLAAVWFGPFDLGVALGSIDPTEPSGAVSEARSRVYEACAKAGVAVCDYAWNAADADDLIARGASLVSLSNDVSMVGRGLRATLSA